MPPAQRRRPPRAAEAPTPEPDQAPSQRRMGTDNARSRGRAAQSVPTTRTMNSQVKAYDYDEEQSEILENVTFPPGVEPARVKVSAGKTISLGASTFEFLRLDVAVEMPCLPSQIEQCYEDASNFAADKLMEEETRWLGSTTTKRAKRG